MLLEQEWTPLLLNMEVRHINLQTQDLSQLPKLSGGGGVREKSIGVQD